MPEKITRFDKAEDFLEHLVRVSKKQRVIPDYSSGGTIDQIFGGATHKSSATSEPVLELDKLNLLKGNIIEAEKIWTSRREEAKVCLANYLEEVRSALENSDYSDILPSAGLINAFKEQIEAYNVTTAGVLEDIISKLKKLLDIVGDVAEEVKRLEEAKKLMNTADIRDLTRKQEDDVASLRGNINAAKQELDQEIEKLDVIWQSPSSNFCKALSELPETPDVTSQVSPSVKNNLQNYLGFQDLTAKTKSELVLV